MNTLLHFYSCILSLTLCIINLTIWRLYVSKLLLSSPLILLTADHSVHQFLGDKKCGSLGFMFYVYIFECEWEVCVCSSVYCCCLELNARSYSEKKACSDQP